jgi:hypothetical protein
VPDDLTLRLRRAAGLAGWRLRVYPVTRRPRCIIVGCRLESRGSSNLGFFSLTRHT